MRPQDPGVRHATARDNGPIAEELIRRNRKLRSLAPSQTSRELPGGVTSLTPTSWGAVLLAQPGGRELPGTFASQRKMGLLLIRELRFTRSTERPAGESSIPVD